MAQDGVPANPRAWLVSTGRFKAIDALRRRARFASAEDHAEWIESIPDVAPPPGSGEDIEDDRLRLIFVLPPRAAARCAGGSIEVRPVRELDAG